MKKLLSIALCLLLSLSLFIAGCSQTTDTDSQSNNTDQEQQGTTNNEEAQSLMTEPGTFPIVNEKITLTFFTGQNPAIEDYKTNEATKYMEELTNVYIDWVVSPEPAQTKNLMLASGDYPDVFFNAGVTPIEEMRYGSQGIFITLNDLIDQYGFNIRNRLFAELPIAEKIITTPDGSIYGIPRVADGYHMSWRNKMWINTTWLNNLGLEAPTNTEEFYQVLKAFKEDDPNGSGKQDTIPLTGLGSDGWNSPVPFIMSAFITDDGASQGARRTIMKDGQVDSIANKPEFREGLRYLHMLYSEGLLDIETFTQDRETQTSKGEAGILGAVSANAPHMFTSIGGEATRSFDVLPPIEGPNGLKSTAYFSPDIHRGYFIITDKCEYPEVALRWVDHLFGEEGAWKVNQGREGVGYRKAEPGEIGVDGNPAIFASIISRGEMQNEFWTDPPGYVNRDYYFGAVAAEDIYSQAGFQRRFIEATFLYEGYEPKESFPDKIYIKMDYIDEVAELETLITGYVNESIARFIIGDLDIENEWDKYVNTLEGMGLERYLEILQQSYVAGR